jgi:hypothetical protein
VEAPDDGAKAHFDYQKPTTPFFAEMLAEVWVSFLEPAVGGSVTSWNLSNPPMTRTPDVE